MKLVIKVFPFTILISLFALSSCDVLDAGSDDNDFDPGDELYQLCAVESGDYSVDAWAETPVETAYTPIYLEVRDADSGEWVDQADITLTPMMDMEEHNHSAPVWQPEAEADTETGLFAGAIIPTMPGGDMGSWYLEWEIDGEPHSSMGDCAIDVANAPNVKVFTADNDERYILTWIDPETPETGSNDFVVTLHHRESMMEFPAVQDLDLEVKPWMGSMDHGSEGNEHPEPIGDGFYEGVVSFNMSGDWEVYVTLFDEGEELYEAEFEIEVE